MENIECCFCGNKTVSLYAHEYKIDEDGDETDFVRTGDYFCETCGQLVGRRDKGIDNFYESTR